MHFPGNLYKQVSGWAGTPKHFPLCHAASNCSSDNGAENICDEKSWKNLTPIRQYSLPPKNLWKNKEHREELINWINLCEYFFRET